MSALPQKVQELLTHLNHTCRREMDRVRDLSDAIRRADEFLLEEVRSVTMLHELRREAIDSELQLLGQRLCVLPKSGPHHEQITAIDQSPLINGHDEGAPHGQPQTEFGVEDAIISCNPPVGGRAGDWRQAAQRIDEELAEYFGEHGRRH